MSYARKHMVSLILKVNERKSSIQGLIEDQGHKSSQREFHFTKQQIDTLIKLFQSSNKLEPQKNEFYIFIREP